MSPSAIIVAGGSGKRFGLKKQFIELLGIPVLKRSVSCFERHPAIDRIVIVVPEEDMATARSLFPDPAKELLFAAGGKTRQESVRNGLDRTVPSDVVLVHDGVRPFVSQELVDRVILGLEGADGCIPGIEVSDTLKESRDGHVTRTVERSGLYRIQTPQAFVASRLAKAHALAAERGRPATTDDSALLEEAGMRVRLVPGDPMNMKITFQGDILLAEAILRCRTGWA